MNSLQPLALVVAMAQNRVIGQAGDLPWHFSEDLKHFRRVTTGHAVIMGRKTWDSIGRPLPGRRNIVVSRQQDLQIAGCEVAGSLERALELARERDEEPRVIGGATLYEQSLPLVTRLFLTEVDVKVDGDTFFPSLDRTQWREVERRRGEADELLFLTLERM
jgi:dihydrofolate reductase